VSRADSASATAFAQRVRRGFSGEVDALELFSPGDTAPPDVVRYTYDTARALRTVTFEDAAGSSEIWRALSTDPFGRVLRARLGNGATEELTYRPDGRRELLAHRVDAGSATRSVLFNGYDGAMLLKETNETSSLSAAPPTVTTFTYGVRNELARAVVHPRRALRATLRIATTVSAT